jgi:hypothetical protein
MDRQPDGRTETHSHVVSEYWEFSEDEIMMAISKLFGIPDDGCNNISFSEGGVTLYRVVEIRS